MEEALFEAPRFLLPMMEEAQIEIRVGKGNIKIKKSKQK
tara:strand:+ start:3760 stop:3876 length:117 start_codon:yes stop_codon:yes gene_type:complete